MAAYPVPPDTSAKEKVIGGILSVTQLVWVLIGLAMGVGLGLLLKLFLGQAGLVIGIIPGIIFAFIFCFVKIHQLTVFQFIMYSRQQKARTKQLPNIRLEGMSKEEKDKLAEMNYSVSNRVQKIKSQPKAQSRAKKLSKFEVGHIM